MNYLLNFGFLGLVKIFLWTLLLMFVIFSFVVVRQVHLMSKVLAVPISGGLKIVALGLLIFAVGIFIVSLVVL
ncbi:hypothetical protein HZB78_02850 [Candidatus Collierbacteria bacterium]|nr:hypothetical protein [Candidatus Collierbacteria bacterium]